MRIILCTGRPLENHRQREHQIGCELNNNRIENSLPACRIGTDIMQAADYRRWFLSLPVYTFRFLRWCVDISTKHAINLFINYQ